MSVDILSPHLDDAVLSSWKMIERPDSGVVTLFAGSPLDQTPSDWDIRTGFNSSGEAMAARRDENAAAIEIAPEKTNIINLPFLDEPYRDAPYAIGELATKVGEIVGGGSILYAPIGIGWRNRRHADHETTREVGKQLLEEGKVVNFYGDIPYLIPQFRTKNWPAKINKEKVKQAIGSDFDMEVHELDAEQQERKQQAVRAYVSQFSLLNKQSHGQFNKSGTYMFEVTFHPK